MPQIDITIAFQFIYNVLTGGWEYFSNSTPVILKIIFWYKVSAYVFIVAGSIFLVYLLLETKKIKNKSSTTLQAASLNVVPEVSVPVNPIWKTIKDKLQSDNPADWQWAIIEADKILDEMVKRMGYPGENLGERLRAIEPSDFLTLNEAWEAHKVRNQIAHESGFTMDRHKAALTISQFERVFNEFGYI